MLVFFLLRKWRCPRAIIFGHSSSHLIIISEYPLLFKERLLHLQIDTVLLDLREGHLLCLLEQLHVNCVLLFFQSLFRWFHEGSREDFFIGFGYWLLSRLRILAIRHKDHFMRGVVLAILFEIICLSMLLLVLLLFTFVLLFFLLMSIF